MEQDLAEKMGFIRGEDIGKNIIGAPGILEAALDALNQRAAIRDKPNGERSALKAANILSAWTGREWAEEDVWRCLLATKMARESQGAFHADDCIDGAGYFALLGECRSINEI